MIFTYSELENLNLDPHHKVKVLYADGSYSYDSTFRWVTGVYKNFIKHDEIIFEIDI